MNKIDLAKLLMDFCFVPRHLCIHCCALNYYQEDISLFLVFKVRHLFVFLLILIERDMYTYIVCKCPSFVRIYVFFLGFFNYKKKKIKSTKNGNYGVSPRFYTYKQNDSEAFCQTMRNSFDYYMNNKPFIL